LLGDLKEVEAPIFSSAISSSSAVVNSSSSALTPGTDPFVLFTMLNSFTGSTLKDSLDFSIDFLNQLQTADTLLLKRNPEGKTILHLALQKSPDPLADSLILLMPDSIFLNGDSLGVTILMEAARQGNPDRLEVLIPLSNPLQTDSSGNNALMFALLNNQEAAAWTLLPHSDTDHQNRNGETAFSLALQSGFQSLADTLIAQGADISQTNNAGQTILMRAIVNSDTLSFLKYLTVQTALQPDISGRTPLRVALSLGEYLMADSLLNYGADVNSGDIWGATPLIIAARYNDTLGAQWLLQFSETNIDQAMHSGLYEGYNALIWAVTENHPEMYILLMSAGANINPDYFGTKSILDWATEYNADLILELLAVE
jgi:ankyrin repeat protein